MASIMTPAMSPTLVEVLGVAGVGKSTLVKSLVESDATFHARPRLDRGRLIAAYLQSTGAFGPILRGQLLLSTTRLSWIELRTVFYLEATKNAARSSALYPDSPGALLLDQGPIYLLAWLKAIEQLRTLMSVYRDTQYKNSQFSAWWRNTLEFWSDHVDVLIWLDAPNHILKQRIRSRSSRHPVEGSSGVDVDLFLSHFRSTYEQTIENVCLLNQDVRVMRFDTHLICLDHICHEVSVNLK